MALNQLLRYPKLSDHRYRCNVSRSCSHCLVTRFYIQEEWINRSSPPLYFAAICRGRNSPNIILPLDMACLNPDQ